MDAGGLQLEDFAHTLNGAYDFEAQARGPLCAAGSMTETSTHAAFVPDGTARIGARLRTASFPDGTEWQREER